MVLWISRHEKWKAKPGNREKLAAALKVCDERRRADPEFRAKRAEASRRFRAEHPESVAATEAKRVRTEEQRERQIEQQREYQTRPEVRERLRMSQRACQIKRRGVPGGENFIDSLIALELSDGVCGICGDEIEFAADFHTDHIIPLSRGGTHTYDNVQASHPPCNIRKRASLPWDVEPDLALVA